MQECVTNAMKHGKCKDIWVKLEWLKDAVNIVVKDDGIGFDPQVVKDHSFGILGMKERIEILNGTITITSEINRGTTVLFKIPLEVK